MWNKEYLFFTLKCRWYFSVNYQNKEILKIESIMIIAKMDPSNIPLSIFWAFWKRKKNLVSRYFYSYSLVYFYNVYNLWLSLARGASLQHPKSAPLGCCTDTDSRTPYWLNPRQFLPSIERIQDCCPSCKIAGSLLIVIT